MAYCIIHPQKPGRYKCYECGKPACGECSFKEFVDSTVKSISSYETVTELKYGYYCPHCFIRFAKNKGYEKGVKGMFFDTKRTQMNGFPMTIPFWITFAFGMVLNFTLFPAGFIAWVPMFILFFVMNHRVQSNFRNYHRALHLTRAKTAQPVRPAKTVTVAIPIRKTQDTGPGGDTGEGCPKCGAAAQDGKFCKECGTQLF